MPFVAGGGDRAGSDDIMIERDRGWTRRREIQIEILTAFGIVKCGTFFQAKSRWLCRFLT